MRFTLHYRGDLPSNGSPLDKHKIRQVFHRQLKTLWGQGFLSTIQFAFTREDPEMRSVLRAVGEFNFLPLVSATHGSSAALEITLLRSGMPGRIVTNRGDIDNQLKTLFDSLAIPQINGLPGGARPEGDEHPYFYCLLEDDDLITDVRVATAQFLEPCIRPVEVELYINVQLSSVDRSRGSIFR